MKKKLSPLRVALYGVIGASVIALFLVVTGFLI
jgi:hypothetical protein